MSNYQTFELDIKPSLLTVYDKVQNQSTKQVGFELFKSLISKHLQLFYYIDIYHNLQSLSILLQVYYLNQRRHYNHNICL